METKRRKKELRKCLNSLRNLKFAGGHSILIKKKFGNISSFINDFRLLFLRSRIICFQDYLVISLVHQIPVKFRN